MPHLLPSLPIRRVVIGLAATTLFCAGPRTQLTGLFGATAPRAAQSLHDETEIKPLAQPVVKPVVVLSAEHRKLCHVVVGDALPDIELADAAGVKHSIQDTLGKKRTVVLFWNADHRYALAEFKHLHDEVVQPFSATGTAVFAIHVGPPPKNYDALVQKYGPGITCLIDGDRQAFAKVATAKLPRTYLLDAQGKILWFDIEYSRTTRFDLRNAIRYDAQKPPVGK